MTDHEFMLEWLLEAKRLCHGTALLPAIKRVGDKLVIASTVKGIPKLTIESFADAKAQWVAARILTDADPDCVSIVDTLTNYDFPAVPFPSAAH